MSLTASEYQEDLLSQSSSLYNDSLCPSHTTDFEMTPVEKLIDKVGGQHTYQFRTLIIFNMVWFLSAWVLMGQSFYFDNQYTCFNTDDSTECSSHICSLSPEERARSLKSHSNSLVFAFEGQYLICQKEYLRPILQSLLYAGSIIGFFLIPYVSDNWGRRIAIRTSWGLLIIGILCICMADSYITVGVGQFLCGFGCNPAISLCYSFLNEQVLGAKRQTYCVIIQLFLAVGECTIAFIFIPQFSFRTVFYVMLVLVAITWVSLSYLLQSPKYLLIRSKNDALIVLNKMAKINSRQPIDPSQINEIDTKQENRRKVSLLDLFSYRSLRWTTIGVGFIFLVTQILYYGTFLNLLNIGYTKVISHQISGISQGLGYLTTELFISKITRKKSSMIGLGLTTISSFIMVLMVNFEQEVDVETMKKIQTAWLMICRFVLCAFIALFYVYVSEIYPTSIRSTGIGLGCAMGVGGSIVAPFISNFTNRLKMNAWILPGGLAIGAFLFIFFLKETYGKPMYDDIREDRIMSKLEGFQGRIGP